MKRYGTFVLVGSITALVAEFFFNVIATKNIGGFTFACFFYPTYLTFVYFANTGFDRLLPSRRLNAMLYLLAFGTLGLMIEWNFLGNSPWHNPDAIQAGMFAFWGAVAFVPKIWLDVRPEAAQIQKRLIQALAAYIGISGLVSLLPYPLGFVGVILTQVVVYIGLFILYARYIRHLDARG